MASLLRCAASALLPVILSGRGSDRPLTPISFLHAGIAPPLAGGCGAGKDLVVQALERMQANSPQDDLADANQLLKRAADLCSEFGDALYYRSLVEAKLGNAKGSAYALQQARKLGSEALNEGLNPFVLATPKTTEPNGKVREHWALVIGIGSFNDPTIPQLQYTANDAQAFHDLLLDPRYGGYKSDNVRMLTDKDATLEKIKESVNWLARKAAPEDLVAVYIASHGSPRTLDTAGANYIITHDTKKGFPVDYDALYATALPMVEFANDIATRIKARRTAVFIDTCFSGNVAEANGKATPRKDKLLGASVSKETLQHISQGSGRIIFAASRNDQESLESADLKHGYFTFYLVEALQAHPDMPLSQVFAYVQQHVSSRVESDYRVYDGRQQNPIMTRSADDADFTLGATPPGSVARMERP